MKEILDNTKLMDIACTHRQNEIDQHIKILEIQEVLKHILALKKYKRHNNDSPYNLRMSPLSLEFTSFTEDELLKESKANLKKNL